MALDGSSTSVMAHENPYHIHVSDYYSRSLSNKPDVVPSGVTERKVSPSDKPDMVALDVISIKESDAPVHRKKREADTGVLGTIHPFRRTHRSVLGRVAQEFSLVTSDRRSWRILLFAVLNLICMACLLMWCSSTNSMALTAYTYLTIFDLFRCVFCGLSFERLEVLAVFASTVLVQLGALFILKESVERFVEQPEVHTGRLLVGTFVALFFNLLTLLSVKNKPFVFVSEAASTSWLQEHVADLSRSLCGLIPALSSVLLPRMNPFVLINLAGACALGITYMLIEINNYNAMDTASAMAIALMIFGTMYPMSVYSGKVLLQTTPSHVIGQLDKLLREVSTLDGVLEVRNEHFWTIGFGSLAGSVHVRIRRDADEQMVLAHVTNRLNTLVSTLTVQIFKDDWARHSLTSSTLPTGSLSLSEYVTSAGFPPVMSKQHDELNPATSTPAKPSSPPPEFSFNTPGKHIQPVVFQTAHQHRPFNAPLSYGMPPYSSMLNQGFAHPSDGPAMRLGFGVGARMPSVQGYRTVNAAPHRYGSSLPSSQTGQQRP
ncbi:zinc transporter 6 [Sinocyclocheilus rhinocerous]|uniref:zinc transporter 6 n=1 Tax=Sinocyclocheilus rhinocerous TaxID=307959 RepID=UPI0007B8B768|nr:PREDICTED: zinc transporter 6 [Sinocyclocheilus rhinocerous]